MPYDLRFRERWSRRSLVLVDHAAKDPSSPYRRAGRYDDGRIMVRWVLGEALVWAVPVEVGHVFVEDCTGVPLVVDQDPVGALGADAADKPFCVAVRLRRP